MPIKTWSPFFNHPSAKISPVLCKFVCKPWPDSMPIASSLPAMHERPQCKHAIRTKIFTKFCLGTAKSQLHP